MGDPHAVAVNRANNIYSSFLDRVYRKQLEKWEQQEDNAQPHPIKFTPILFATLCL